MAGQTETVISAILGAIESGALNPGDMIEEQVLSERHGVSRTPIREALIKLETAGLVQRLPRKGAVVFKPTLEEFLAILEVHAKNKPDEIFRWYWANYNAATNHAIQCKYLF